MFSRYKFGQCSIQRRNYTLFYEITSVKSLSITPENRNQGNVCLKVIYKGGYLSITCGTKSKRQSGYLSLGKMETKKGDSA